MKTALKESNKKVSGSSEIVANDKKRPGPLSKISKEAQQPWLNNKNRSGSSEIISNKKNKGKPLTKAALKDYGGNVDKSPLKKRPRSSVYSEKCDNEVCIIHM